MTSYIFMVVVFAHLYTYKQFKTYWLLYVCSCPMFATNFIWLATVGW